MLNDGNLDETANFRIQDKIMRHILKRQSILITLLLGGLVCSCEGGDQVVRPGNAPALGETKRSGRGVSDPQAYFPIEVGTQWE